MQKDLFGTPTRLSKQHYWEQFKAIQGGPLFVQAVKDPAFCEHMNALARKYMDDMVEIALEKYRSKISMTTIHMKLDWGRKRRTSRGGMKKREGYLTIAMYRATVPFPVKEYARIDADPEIGYMNTWSSEAHLACTIAHELAHVFQYLIRAKALRKKVVTKWDRAYHARGHGENWRSIYRLLRREYVNKNFRVEA